MKEEAGSQIGTAGFLDGITSQREVRNRKKRDSLFSTANNSTPRRKHSPADCEKKAAEGF